jgi:hypothetical protein
MPAWRGACNTLTAARRPQCGGPVTRCWSYETSNYLLNEWAIPLFNPLVQSTAGTSSTSIGRESLSQLLGVSADLLDDADSDSAPRPPTRCQPAPEERSPSDDSRRSVTPVLFQRLLMRHSFPTPAAASLSRAASPVPLPPHRCCPLLPSMKPMSCVDSWSKSRKYSPRQWPKNYNLEMPLAQLCARSMVCSASSRTAQQQGSRGNAPADVAGSRTLCTI